MFYGKGQVALRDLNVPILYRNRSKTLRKTYLKAIDYLLFVLLALRVARVKGGCEFDDKLILKDLALSPDIQAPFDLGTDLVVAKVSHCLLKHTLDLVHHLGDTFPFGVLGHTYMRRLADYKQVHSVW